MRVTIGKDTLDIRDWPGKKQRLQTAIDSEMYDRSKSNTLPFKLIMSPEQYEMLKNTVEFGIKGEWRYKQPEDRIYVTLYNAMEVAVK